MKEELEPGSGLHKLPDGPVAAEDTPAAPSTPMYDGCEEIDLTFDMRYVVVKDPKTGTRIKYRVREMDGTLREKHTGGMMARVDLNPDTGKVDKIKNTEGMQTDLIMSCIGEMGVYNAKGEFVPHTIPKMVEREVVSGWPAHAFKRVHQICQEVCGLDDDATKKVKKD